jgi:hypothetical protein
MTHLIPKHTLIMCAVALILPLGTATAKSKKKAQMVQQSEPAAKPRLPGYAVISLENGNRDKLRVSEGESRATIPNNMANDVDFITVVGAHTVITVYEQPNFRGHSLTLRCGSYELLQQPRNDIESLKVRYAKTTVSKCRGEEGQPVQYKTWDR